MSLTLGSFQKIKMTQYKYILGVKKDNKNHVSKSSFTLKISNKCNNMKVPLYNVRTNARQLPVCE